MINVWQVPDAVNIFANDLVALHAFADFIVESHSIQRASIARSVAGTAGQKAVDHLELQG